MKFKDLLLPENQNLDSAFHLTVEADDVMNCDNIPDSLKNLGFVMEVDEDGMIQEALLDVLITLKLKNLHIVMEVPADLISSGKVEAKYVLQMASNVDFEVALLPNRHPLVKDVTQEQYKDVIMATLKEMLARPNFDKIVYPISSFFEYLMMEKILGVDSLKDFKPDHPFIVENFYNIMPVEESDSFKGFIRQAIYDFYGGKENFEVVAGVILESLSEKSKQMFEEQVRLDTNKPKV